MICTVTFNPSLDYIVRVDDMRLGAINRTAQFTDSLLLRCDLIIQCGNVVSCAPIAQHLLPVSIGC